MARTRTALIAGAGATALVLSACIGGSGSGTAAGGSGNAAKKVTSIKLVAAEYSKDHTAAFWKQFAEKYKAKTGITLDVQVVSWDSIDQQSSTMIQNNNAPDLLNLNVYASYAKDKLLYSADEVLAPAIKADVLDAFVKSGTYQGKMYGMPDLSSARALFYNKDLFTKAGIAAPPKTWDEFEADDKKVNYGVAPMPTKEAGGTPQTFGVTDYLMAFKKSGNQTAIKAFYDLYYQKDQVNTFIKDEGFLPVTKSGLEVFASDPKLKVYLDTLPNVHLTPTDDPTWDKVKLAVQQNIGAGVGTSGDPKAVLDALQKTAESGG